MAVKARAFIFHNSVFTLQHLDDDGKPTGSEVQVCGINGCTYTVGEPSKISMIDWCSEAEEFHYGIPSESTLELPVSKFDPTQDGQKMLLSTELNTPFFLKATLVNGMEMTGNVKLASKMGFSVADQNPATSQIKFGVTTQILFAEKKTTP